MKNRLFALEKRHRTTRDVGITETSLARGINSFATRIGAPGFAQTNTLQLRVFRAQLHFLGLSDVVAPGLSQKTGGAQPAGHAAVPATIPAEIGPAEASILIGVMLRSKLLNEDLQVAPDEWSRAFSAKRAQARQNQIAAASGTQNNTRIAAPTHSLLAVGVSPQSSALQSSLQSFVNSMGSSDAMNKELDTFVKEIGHE